MKTLDARGWTCPLPVIETKKLTETMNAGDQLEVLVDNEIAVQNLTKFAAQRNHAVVSSKVEEKKYQVILTVGSQESCECELDQTSDFIVAIGSNKMGEGDPALGTALMKAFIFALTKQDQFPTTMLFFNSGAYLTCQDSDVLEDLKTLESKGVEIFTCGTCLNFYGLNEKLAIGSVTNMYDIVEKMEKAGKVVKP